MPNPLPRPSRLVSRSALALLLALGGCRLGPGRSAPEPATMDQVQEQLLQQRLAALFPELPGPIDRAAIEGLLRRERVALPDPRDEELRSELRAALDSADLARARDLLVERLGTRELDEALALLDSGDAPAALARLDRTAQTLSSSPRLLALRGEARWRVGRAWGDEALIVSAREDLAQASLALPSARVFTRLAEVSSHLAAPLPAREAAERAVALAGRLGPEGEAERERARASVQEWRMRAETGATQEELAPSAARARIALEEWLGFAPYDAWAWSTRAELLAATELPGVALAACWRSLEWLPEEPQLHAIAARLCLSLGGPDRLIEEYGRWSTAHPRVALAAWFPAQAALDAGVEQVLGERDGRAYLTLAMREYQRFCSLAPGQAEAAALPMIEAQLAAVWSQIHAGDWVGAERPLIDLEAAQPGALARGDLRVASGLKALEWIGSRWAKGIEDPDSSASLLALAQAGAIYERLNALAPLQPDWANNAGFFLRDLGVAMELNARNACRRGERETADALGLRARDLMERSWRAYESAAWLSPEDARVVNDAGVILTYYLQRDPETAQRCFERAIELGQARLPELEAAGQTRELEELQTAIGDAEQNLGVLLLTLRGDAQAALVHLERCRGMGPDPRPEVVGPGGFLERCRTALNSGADPRVQESERWGAPCAR
ncbi:MAG: hypothetical protein RL277_917 [Planctomycetota bacterium]